MTKELEVLNILRDNHIKFTKEKYGELDKEKLQKIINLKLARWDIIEKALKRNEPMKVYIGFFYDCPKCGKTLRRTYNYCPDCGQKLDWSDEE